jgi:excinuclease ABC subunit A
MSSLFQATNGDSLEFIRIRGARMHNLRNIDLDIPRDRLVVITGVSGSGKSSLAFDTLYAEGQRQYIESLSVYARQFLHQMERADVDLIEGLQPTIAIDQRAGSHHPRSTVATVTEIYDYLRLLMARLGEASCYRCGAPIRQQSPEEILERLMALGDGTRVVLLAPLVRGRKGQHAETFEQIRKAGLVRARVDGEVYELDALPELARQKAHTIEAVVDRIVIREAGRSRLAESLRTAVQMAEGTVIACHGVPASGTGGAAPVQWRDELFSTRYACPNCKISYQELEPRTFSFNSPYGACPACEGLGVRVDFDADLIAPDLSRSLARGAIVPWRDVRPGVLRRYKEALAEFLSANDLCWNTPLAKFTPKQRQQLLGGARGFPGVLQLVAEEYEATGDVERRDQLEAFRAETACPECGGSRLRPEARAVRLAGKAIHEVSQLTVSQAAVFFAELHFAREDQAIAQPLVGEIRSRLDFLHKVGLDYLTLDRPAQTLSGGESQRIRLATGIGSSLVGVCYVLDEPSMGLHPRDNDRLIDALRQLQLRGNSVLVVEHDEAVMRRADWLVDMGPDAGLHGGRVVAQGSPSEVSRNDLSLTGRYLSGQARIPLPSQRREVSSKRALVLEGATCNNLKDLTARFPLGVFVCVTGVSGSGKSSLLNETLARAVFRELYGSGPKPAPYKSLKGLKQIDKLVQVDQSPIGRTPRSNPATYTGAFDEIRKVFITTREARLRGYKAGRFSFNVKGGRCEECQGHGLQKIEMNFLPDLYVTCPVCQGKRFNRQTLEARYRGKSIADVLDLRVDEALAFFENFPVLRRQLGALDEVGLGYLTLGQSSTTLSGGESQRIKLAAELCRVETGRTLYILDEPTTGLHFDDIQKLLAVLNRLVDLGNTVIVIEHHLDVIKSSDWLIDLGPEGGEAGGRILAAGTPEDLAALPDNATGRYLQPLLA